MTDSVNGAREAVEIARDVAWQRIVDSLKHHGDSLRTRLARQAPKASAAAAAIIANPDSTVPKRQALAVLAENVLLKGVIAQDSADLRARDARILELTRSVRLYADSIVPQLTKDRDWWKSKASSPCGLGGSVGLGIRGADAVAGFTCRISLPHLF